MQLRRRFVRDSLASRNVVRARAAVLEAVGVRELHLLVHLPSQAPAIVLGPVGRDRWLTQVRLVEQRAVQLVVVAASLLFLCRPAAERAIEPQFVLDDGATHAGADIVDVLFARRDREATIDQIASEVLALKPGPRVIAKRIDTELVAALSGHD